MQPFRTNGVWSPKTEVKSHENEVRSSKTEWDVVVFGQRGEVSEMKANTCIWNWCDFWGVGASLVRGLYCQVDVWFVWGWRRCMGLKTGPLKEAHRLGNGASNKGGPNSIPKNNISFRCKKRTQKLASWWTTMLVKSASTWKTNLPQWRGQKGKKLDPPGGTTFNSKRVHFLTIFETRFFCTEVQNWTLSLKVRF
jgi:hypothetical protein